MFNRNKNTETLEKEFAQLKAEHSSLKVQVGELIETNKKLAQEVATLKVDRRTAAMQALDIVAGQGVPLGTVPFEKPPQPQAKADPQRIIKSISRKDFLEK
jgi:hypothetical protein